MRILILSQWCDPEPTIKALQFARALRSFGHDVEIVTGFPNYPGGKIYPGFRMRPLRREIVDGVSVLRVALFASHDRSGVRRAANYLSFALSATLGALCVRRPDIVYVYHPPGTIAFPALAMKWLRRAPFVFDIQDLWPDTLAVTGMIANRYTLALVGAFMRLVYTQAAAVVVLSEGFRAALIAKGVPEDKITVIPNWTFETSTGPRAATDRVPGGEFQILFAGNMGKAQSLETVLAAARILADRAPRARFVLLGAGVEMESLRRLAKALPNVSFRERIDPYQMDRELAGADALLVHLKDDPLFAITIPSKTQAYLRAGRPILMGVRGDAARMVADAGAGLGFSPEDPESLADRVVELMAMTPEARVRMGESGQAYYERRLSLSVGTRRFVDLFEAVSTRRKGGRRLR